MHFVLIMQRRKCVCVSPVLQGVTGAGAGGGRERRGGMHVPLCNDLTCNPPTRIVKRRETISAVGGKFIAQTAGSSSVVGDIKTFTLMEAVMNFMKRFTFQEGYDGKIRIEIGSDRFRFK